MLHVQMVLFLKEKNVSNQYKNVRKIMFGIKRRKSVSVLMIFLSMMEINVYHVTFLTIGILTQKVVSNVNKTNFIILTLRNVKGVQKINHY